MSDRFPHADSICLSPEISDRAVAAIVANVDQVVKDRGVKLALPVYGRFGVSDDGSEPVTGSSLYLREPLDLIDAIPWILKSGVQELRLEFTTERFAQVEEILRRVKNVSSSGRYSTYSYGFTRDGVF